MIKKLLLTLLVTLFLSVGASTDDRAPIKYKNIECSYSSLPGRENHSFLMITENDKSAKLVMIPWNTVEEYNVDIKKTLTTITFNINNDWDEVWILERKTGVMKVFSKGKFSHNKDCMPFEKDFDPSKFLKNFIKKNTKELIEKNKF